MELKLSKEWYEQQLDDEYEVGCGVGLKRGNLNILVARPNMYKYEYPRPGFTADNIVLNTDNKILLVKRANPPFEDMWAIPGGFVEYGETAFNAAKRELKEETGLDSDPEFFMLADSPNRDPRGWVVSAVFHSTAMGKIRLQEEEVKDYYWIGLPELLLKPELIAFDHHDILVKFFEMVLGENE